MDVKKIMIIICNFFFQRQDNVEEEEEVPINIVDKIFKEVK